MLRKHFANTFISYKGCGTRGLAASGAADDGRLEVLVEELPLGEAHPPLAGLVLAKGVHGLDETVAGLLPELGQVLTDLVSLGTVGRVGDEASKSEVLVAGNREVLDGEVEEVLLGAALALVHHLVDGLRDVERQVDEDAVSRALDLVVPEQHVGLEEADRLIDDVGLVSRASVAGSGTLVLGLDGQHAHAAHDAKVGLLVVLRVVGGHYKLAAFRSEMDESIDVLLAPCGAPSLLSPGATTPM